MPWLYAISRRVKIDAYRRRRSEVYEQPLESIAEPAAPQAQATHALPDIGQLLEKLPDSQREVISLLKISGLTIEEVARATSSSVGSVKQKAHRAYEKLRTVLAEFKPTGEKEGAL